MRQRRRPRVLWAVIFAAALVSVGCSSQAADGDGGSTPQSASDASVQSSTGESGDASTSPTSGEPAESPSSSAAPEASSSTALTGTVTLWHFFTDRQADVVQSVLDDFQKANPGVTVEVHGGQNDDAIAKIIATGGKVDVAILGGSGNLGSFCNSGSFVDLAPYLQRDNVDMANFVQTALDYSKYNDTLCSLPMLTDVYGLYYNKKLLQGAGYSAPPKSLSELQDMALKLTTYNADGSIKTLGFNPLIGFYENASPQWSAITGGTWIKDGKSAIGADPAWRELMEWQAGLIKKIGYDKIKAFTAGLGDEWSADNAFQKGDVAMIIDGEWRTAFIKDQTPQLDYGTAPVPTGDNQPELYGGGYSSGSIVGLAHTAKNPDLAWALVKYLTTDTGALVKLTNGLGNVPTTKAALDSPDLDLPGPFKAFLDIEASPHLTSLPNTPIGRILYTTLNQFWQSYQSGEATDLEGGLKQVDVDINNALDLAGA